MITIEDLLAIIFDKTLSNNDEKKLMSYIKEFMSYKEIYYFDFKKFDIDLFFELLEGSDIDLPKLIERLQKWNSKK